MSAAHLFLEVTCNNIGVETLYKPLATFYTIITQTNVIENNYATISKICCLNFNLELVKYKLKPVNQEFTCWKRLRRSSCWQKLDYPEKNYLFYLTTTNYLTCHCKGQPWATVVTDMSITHTASQHI